MIPSVYAPKDFKRLRAVGDIVARCFDHLVQYVRAGISTAEIDRIANEFLVANGARSSDFGYMGFPKHITTSRNDVIVHGVPRDDEILQDGDIINIDLTAEYKGFHGDASRMYLVGNVSNSHKKLVSVCEDALNSAIAVCGPGVALSEIGRVIEEVVNPHGFAISHDFVGHGIGKIMHDEPQIYHWYDKKYDKVKMVPGFVFTIEPMICEKSALMKMDDDGWTARTVDGGWSAQWEHTIGITEDGAEIFTEIKKYE